MKVLGKLWECYSTSKCNFACWNWYEVVTEEQAESALHGWLLRLEYNSQNPCKTGSGSRWLPVLGSKRWESSCGMLTRQSSLISNSQASDRPCSKKHGGQLLKMISKVYLRHAHVHSSPPPPPPSPLSNAHTHTEGEKTEIDKQKQRNKVTGRKGEKGFVFDSGCVLVFGGMQFDCGDLINSHNIGGKIVEPIVFKY